MKIPLIKVTLDEFLTKQDSIYQDFDTAKINLVQDGLKPKVSPDSKLSGYLVMCRHKNQISSKASDFSSAVSKVIPALRYNSEHIHTTLSDYQMSESTVYVQNTLDKLNQVVASIKSKVNAFSISYPKWLINQDSIIAAGYPDPMFFTIADLIVKKALELGVELRYPRMAHITVSRFFKNCHDAEILKQLLRLINETGPLGISRVENVEVGFVRHYQGKIDFIAGGTEKLD